MRAILVLAIVLCIALLSGFAFYMSGSTTPSTSGTSSSTLSSTKITTSSSAICTLPGQSFGLYLDVASDSTHAPLSGANVTAVYGFNAGCESAAYDLVSQSFITNETEWYFLYGLNDGNYSLEISYSGQTVNLTAQLRPSTYTCASIFLPSGKDNVTVSPEPC